MTLAVSIAQSGANNVTMRNRLINGAMTIAQRGTSAISVNNTENFPVDRTNVRCNTSGISATTQQSSTAPTGFRNSIVVTVTTGAAAASSDRGYVLQKVEGYNVQDFMLGTSGAVAFTLSFWVRSSLTGTFSGSFQNGAQDRSYVFTYTISSANTWEYKTITVSAGDTSGAWNTDNSIGVFVCWDLGNGSALRTSSTGAWLSGDYRGATSAVSPFANSGATFFLTGVQLEEGSTATAFEQRLYGTELNLCMRYYTKFSANDGAGNYATFFGGSSTSNTQVIIQPSFPVPLRATGATQTYGGSIRIATSTTTGLLTSLVAANQQLSTTGGYGVWGCASHGLGTQVYVRFEGNGDANAFWAFSAEL